MRAREEYQLYLSCFTPTESRGWEEQFWWGQQEKGRFLHDTDHKNPPGKIESGRCVSVKPPGTAT